MALILLSAFSNDSSASVFWGAGCAGSGWELFRKYSTDSSWSIPARGVEIICEISFGLVVKFSVRYFADTRCWLDWSEFSWTSRWLNFKSSCSVSSYPFSGIV